MEVITSDPDRILRYRWTVPNPESCWIEIELMVRRQGQWKNRAIRIQTFELAKLSKAIDRAPARGAEDR